MGGKLGRETAVFGWTAQGCSEQGRTQKQTLQPGCLNAPLSNCVQIVQVRRHFNSQAYKTEYKGA